MFIELKTPQEMAVMDDAGRIITQILRSVRRGVRDGMSTKELEDIAVEEMQKYGVEPAFLGFRGFPANICVSLNEELVHGIPDRTRRIKDGDIVKADIGIKHKGFCGDIAETIPVGKVSPEIRKLLAVTYGCFNEVMKHAKQGNRLGDVSGNIQKYVEGNGYSVIREYVGHGIGRNLHEKPEVPNFGLPGIGPKLAAGMVLAVEPMVAAGGWKTKTLKDNWTVVTADGGLCAHFEHMVAITENGPRFMTEMDPPEPYE
ncbi:MAG: type I methionyl aminopeptidase [Elusimicrobia bacterium]|nr:type I methionyl aminopeptidase [Elusimicrobiota bacterium]